MTTKTINTTAGYAETARSRSAPRANGTVFLHTAASCTKSIEQAVDDIAKPFLRALDLDFIEYPPQSEEERTGREAYRQQMEKCYKRAKEESSKKSPPPEKKEKK